MKRNKKYIALITLSLVAMVGCGTKTVNGQKLNANEQGVSNTSNSSIASRPFFTVASNKFSNLSNSSKNYLSSMNAFSNNSKKAKRSEARRNEINKSLLNNSTTNKVIKGSNSSNASNASNSKSN